MISMKQIPAFIISSLLLFSAPTFASFKFCQGNSGEEGGSDTFQQQIPLQGIVEVGELPSGISGVEIFLTSPVDIDIQLYDKETGKKLIHWPNGVLSASGYQSFVYHNTLIEWSGYNGDGTGLGNEYIKISNNNDPSAPTSRTFIMKAFGYKAGLADIDYSWKGASCDTASGNGSFQQQIVQNAIVTVGDIPIGINNLNIKLKSSTDVDIQLYDADDGKAIIAWPSGLLNGSTTQSLSYQGMKIEWSGYNGDGSGAGNEYIKISGKTTRNLTMKAFGYHSGAAAVNYSWGDSNDNSGNNEGGDSPTGEEATVKSQILSLINKARSLGRTCGSTFYPATTPLTWNSKLYQAALGHSNDMATNNFFSHTGSDGKNAGSRITAAGYSWFTYGENIATGYFSAQSVIDGWLASSGHCKNIMNPSVTNVAAARATGGPYGIYWTQVFAAGQ